MAQTLMVHSGSSVRQQRRLETWSGYHATSHIVTGYVKSLAGPGTCGPGRQPTPHIQQQLLLTHHTPPALPTACRAVATVVRLTLINAHRRVMTASPHCLSSFSEVSVYRFARYFRPRSDPIPILKYRPRFDTDPIIVLRLVI